MNPITTNFGYTGGFQNYTVTVTGTYDLSAYGAGGGSTTNGATFVGGSGAEIGGTFNLNAGQQLQIIVGGSGNGPPTGGAGGGGFSQILVNSGANGTYVPLLIAGGGGGASVLAAGSNASGMDTNLGSGGSGGGIGFGPGGGGGAGAISDGADGDGLRDPNSGQLVLGGSGGSAAASASGAAGGSGGVNDRAGGFGGGGGGGASAFGGGGGGGGSTGGMGGGGNGEVGAGGTSYLASSGTLNTAETRSGAGVSTGNGSATLRFVPAAAPAPAPCYVTGTRIRVLRGLMIQDVPVERLTVGDLALTASGKPRPIRWIGNRAYPGLTAPQADRPVRIAADALSPGVPARDLLVSPDHALMLDGLFVAAGHLVNGETITRGEAVTDLTYWHVELDSHDLLMAENTPAESFLAAPGVRRQFDGTAVLDTAFAPVACAVRAERGPELQALRDRLIVRAGLSIEPGRFGVMRSWLDLCDGTRVAGWAQDAEHPDGPICLDILVDGEVVAMTLAEDHRADVEAAGVGRGRHGFDLDLEDPLASGVAHTVEVRRSADGVSIGVLRIDAAGHWSRPLAA